MKLVNRRLIIFFVAMSFAAGLNGELSQRVIPRESAPGILVNPEKRAIPERALTPRQSNGSDVSFSKPKNARHPSQLQLPETWQLSGTFSLNLSAVNISPRKYFVLVGSHAQGRAPPTST